jgi:tetratricopeptide (TPR) repeat protein
MEALCASVTFPPLFDPISIGPRLRKQRFIGGALGFYNPAREILKEANMAYGDEQRVALILSLGCGLPSVMSFNSSPSISCNIESLVRYIATDCERVAKDIGNQFIQVDAYVRLNVNRGLEEVIFDDWSCIGSIEGCIKAYLEAAVVTRALDAVSEKITKHVESITLGQLSTVAITMFSFVLLSFPLDRSTRVEYIAKVVPSVSPYYVVRLDEWETMVRCLVTNMEDKRKIFAITGMGGSGKTQMVAYFVEKHRNRSVDSMTSMGTILINDRYRRIFFIDASTVATIRGDLESAIRSINGHERDTYEGALAFLSRPPEGGEWLYILDNADDSDLDLIPYIPSCSHGTIIITSRNRRVGILTTTHHLELGPMQEQEAVETLRRAARKTKPLDEAESAHAIHLVETLGYLALAIVQAGIYIHEMTSGTDGGFSFGQYSSLYKCHRDRLLREKSYVSLDRYPCGVYETLDISYTRLPESCREFLHLCSFLRHTSIPVSIFSSASTADFEDSWELESRPPEYQIVKFRLRQLFSRNGEWDQLHFHKLVQTLSSFSLLTISFAHDLILVRLHPLVHSHARDKLMTEQLKMYKQMAITCISAGYMSLPLNARQYVLPHCTRIYEEDGGDSLHINDMIRFGELIESQGNYWLAEKVFKSIVDMLVTVQGDDHKDTITVLSYMASTLWSQGKWSDAEVLERKVLAMRQKTLGSEHPDTITASANLASTLRDQGSWNEAEELEREVLSTLQKILGPEHPDTITASANLASTFRNQGRWNEAEALERSVLANRQRILGLEHPDTIKATANLASTFCDQGKWNEAEVLNKEVLATRQRILGPDHPDTIKASANLASTLRNEGKWNDAEALEKEVLIKRQKILGIEHPDTIDASANLASTLWSQGKCDEAEVLEIDVLIMRQRTLGFEHPDTIAASANLASTLGDRGKWNEAETLEREVLAMRQRILGMEHPDTITASANLASTLGGQGKWNEAEVLDKQVIAMSQKILGMEHPHTIDASANWASTLYNQQKWSEAEVLQREVLTMRQRILGLEHPDSIVSLDHLAATLYKRGRTEEALSLSLQATQLAEKVMGLSHTDTVLYFKRLKRLYLSSGRYEEASKVQRKLDPIDISR